MIATLKFENFFQQRIYLHLVIIRTDLWAKWTDKAGKQIILGDYCIQPTKQGERDICCHDDRELNICFSRPNSGDQIGFLKKALHG